MSLLGALLVVAAWLIACCLVALADAGATKIGLAYPRWVIAAAYVVISAIAVLYVLTQLRVWQLLSSVRV